MTFPYYFVKLETSPARPGGNTHTLTERSEMQAPVIPHSLTATWNLLQVDPKWRFFSPHSCCFEKVAFWVQPDGQKW